MRLWSRNPTDYIQVVTFQLAGLDPAVYRAQCEAKAQAFTEISGLREKAWLANPSTNTSTEKRMSPRTLQSTLDHRAGALIGRERERAALLELLEGETPLVAVVHGIAGVGKSALLQAAAVDARAR